MLQFDNNLQSLFHDMDNSSKIPPSTSQNQTSIAEAPEHYDPKDIEKDYKS
jgi:hypothetical protein